MYSTYFIVFLWFSLSPVQQAEEAGLPKPLPSADISAITVQGHEAFLHHLYAQESAKLAEAESAATMTKAEQEIRRLSEMMKDYLVRVALR